MAVANGTLLLLLRRARRILDATTDDATMLQPDAEIFRLDLPLSARESYHVMKIQW